jgi:hypothetical protein
MRNYTSTVPAEKSVSNIEKRLVGSGATNIVKTYENGILGGLYFTIRHNKSDLPFKMPARVAQVHERLLSNIRRPHKNTVKKLQAQSERTAWKLLSEWVDIQLTLVELGQADLAEIFLPYVYDHKLKKTLYEKISSGDLKLLE